MKILADVHTHTIASGHAYSTIDENMRAAADKGLEVLVMTDHSEGMPGGAHDFHFSNLKTLPNEMYGVKLLKGAEVNVMDYKGNLDFSQEMLEKLDMAIASLHPPCIAFADEETVTACIEKVMENPYVSMIGHPGDQRYPMDYERIVKKAQATGTLLEVNNASLKPGSFRIGVRESLIVMLNWCKKLGVPVVIGSDAHFHTQVGALQESLLLLEEVDFPEALVLNGDPTKLLKIIAEKRLK